MTPSVTTLYALEKKVEALTKRLEKAEAQSELDRSHVATSLQSIQRLDLNLKAMLVRDTARRGALAPPASPPLANTNVRTKCLASVGRFTVCTRVASVVCARCEAPRCSGCVSMSTEGGGWVCGEAAQESCRLERDSKRHAASAANYEKALEREKEAPPVGAADQEDPPRGSSGSSAAPPGAGDDVYREALERLVGAITTEHKFLPRKSAAAMRAAKEALGEAQLCAACGKVLRQGAVRVEVLGGLRHAKGSPECNPA